MAPSLKNARSFLLKLVHPLPSRKVANKSKPAKSDQTHPSSAHQRIDPPPEYEVPVPPPSRSSNTRAMDSSEYLLEQVIDSSLRRLKARANSEYASSICSSTHLPLATPEHTVVLPSHQNQRNLVQNQEEVESLTERSILRHHNSSQQTRRMPHDRPGRRTSSAHKNLKANNSPRNLHRKSAPRLTDPTRSSHSRRERELLTAKKSLPILT